MRVLLALIRFAELTGAELYCHDLAVELTRRGNAVAIVAPETGGEIARRARDAGVEVFSFEDCPPGWHPDVLHVQELVPAAFALALYPRAAVVATVHSEFAYERPFVSDRVWRYVCVRPSVEAHVRLHYGVPADRTLVIGNGIDADRFRRVAPRAGAPPRRRRVLFVGSVDHLRRGALEDLIARGARDGFRVRVVGERREDYLDRSPAHVELVPPTWHVERHLAEADETAGVLFGRTTVESWFAGLPAWVYDIDRDGSVRSRDRLEPPADLSEFEIGTVTDRLWDVYREAVSAVRADDLGPAVDSLGLAAAVNAAELVRMRRELADVRGEMNAWRRRFAGVAHLAERVARVRPKRRRGG